MPTYDVIQIGFRVADHIQAMLAYWDKNQLCRFANRAYLEWFGKTPEEMIDKITMKDLLGPLYEQNLPYIMGALQGKAQLFEREIRIPSGETRYSIANYYPDIVNGTVRGFYVHVADISSVKKLEMELLASEKKFKDLMERAPDAILIADKYGIIQMTNAQCEKLFGYPKTELMGMAVEKLLPQCVEKGHDPKTEIVFRQTSATAGKRLEVFGVSKKGNQFPVELSIGGIEWNGEAAFSLVIRDVSERHEVENKIRVSEEKYRSLVENSHEAFFLTIPDGSILEANQAAADIFGYTREELRSMSRKAIIDHNDPHLLPLLQERERTGKVKGEATGVRKNGERFPVEFASTFFTDVDGKIKTSTVLSDISQRKEAEEKIRNYSILESKSKEMEQFAYVASHDLREPLLTIIKFSEHLGSEYTDCFDEKALRYVKGISRAAKRSEELIRGLMDYSRLSKLKQMQQVDCNEVLEEVQADLTSLITSTNACVAVGELPVVNGYPLAMKLLFQSLIENAIKFRKANERPEVRIACQKIKKGWEFVVQDNGIGIEEKDKEKIFNIFQKLHSKKLYDGPGIGLAQCKKITELHNGTIWVDSAPGKGSKFYFTIFTNTP